MARSGRDASAVQHHCGDTVDFSKHNTQAWTHQHQQQQAQHGQTEVYEDAEEEKEEQPRELQDQPQCHEQQHEGEQRGNRPEEEEEEIAEEPPRRQQWERDQQQQEGDEEEQHEEEGVEGESAGREEQQQGKQQQWNQRQATREQAEECDGEGVSQEPDTQQPYWTHRQPLWNQPEEGLDEEAEVEEETQQQHWDDQEEERDEEEQPQHQRGGGGGESMKDEGWQQQTQEKQEEHEEWQEEEDEEDRENGEEAASKKQIRASPLLFHAGGAHSDDDRDTFAATAHGLVIRASRLLVALRESHAEQEIHRRSQHQRPGLQRLQQPRPPLARQEKQNVFTQQQYQEQDGQRLQMQQQYVVKDGHQVGEAQEQQYISAFRLPALETLPSQRGFSTSQKAVAAPARKNFSSSLCFVSSPAISSSSGSESLAIDSSFSAARRVVAAAPTVAAGAADESAARVPAPKDMAAAADAVAAAVGTAAARPVTAVFAAAVEPAAAHSRIRRQQRAQERRRDGRGPHGLRGLCEKWSNNAGNSNNSSDSNNNRRSGVMKLQKKQKQKQREKQWQQQKLVEEAATLLHELSKALEAAADALVTAEEKRSTQQRRAETLQVKLEKAINDVDSANAEAEQLSKALQDACDELLLLRRRCAVLERNPNYEELRESEEAYAAAAQQQQTLQRQLSNLAAANRRKTVQNDELQQELRSLRKSLTEKEEELLVLRRRSMMRMTQQQTPRSCCGFKLKDTGGEAGFSSSSSNYSCAGSCQCSTGCSSARLLQPAYTLPAGNCAAASGWKPEGSSARSRAAASSVDAAVRAAAVATEESAADTAVAAARHIAAAAAALNADAAAAEAAAAKAAAVEWPAATVRGDRPAGEMAAVARGTFCDTAAADTRMERSAAAAATRATPACGGGGVEINGGAAAVDVEAFDTTAVERGGDAFEIAAGGAEAHGTEAGGTGEAYEKASRGGGKADEAAATGSGQREQHWLGSRDSPSLRPACVPPLQLKRGSFSHKPSAETRRLTVSAAVAAAAVAPGAAAAGNTASFPTAVPTATCCTPVQLFSRKRGCGKRSRRRRSNSSSNNHRRGSEGAAVGEDGPLSSSNCSSRSETSRSSGRSSCSNSSSYRSSTDKCKSDVLPSARYGAFGDAAIVRTGETRNNAAEGVQRREALARASSRRSNSRFSEAPDEDMSSRYSSWRDPFSAQNSRTEHHINGQSSSAGAAGRSGRRHRFAKGSGSRQRDDSSLSRCWASSASNKLKRSYGVARKEKASSCELHISSSSSSPCDTDSSSGSRSAHVAPKNCNSGIGETGEFASDCSSPCDSPGIAKDGRGKRRRSSSISVGKVNALGRGTRSLSRQPSRRSVSSCRSSSSNRPGTFFSSRSSSTNWSSATCSHCNNISESAETVGLRSSSRNKHAASVDESSSSTCSRNRRSCACSSGEVMRSCPKSTARSSASNSRCREGRGSTDTEAGAEMCRVKTGGSTAAEEPAVYDGRINATDGGEEAWSAGAEEVGTKFPPTSATAVADAAAPATTSRHGESEPLAVRPHAAAGVCPTPRRQHLLQILQQQRLRSRAQQPQWVQEPQRVILQQQLIHQQQHLPQQRDLQEQRQTTEERLVLPHQRPSAQQHQQLQLLQQHRLKHELEELCTKERYPQQNAKLLRQLSKRRVLLDVSPRAATGNTSVYAGFCPDPAAAFPSSSSSPSSCAVPCGAPCCTGVLAAAAPSPVPSYDPSHAAARVFCTPAPTFSASAASAEFRSRVCPIAAASPFEAHVAGAESAAMDDEDELQREQLSMFDELLQSALLQKPLTEEEAELKLSLDRVLLAVAATRLPLHELQQKGVSEECIRTIAELRQQQEAKQQEAKQQETRQQETRQQEAKQQETRQQETRQQETKQQEAKQAEAKQEETQRQQHEQQQRQQQVKQQQVEGTGQRQHLRQYAEGGGWRCLCSGGISKNPWSGFYGNQNYERSTNDNATGVAAGGAAGAAQLLLSTKWMTWKDILPRPLLWVVNRVTFRRPGLSSVLEHSRLSISNSNGSGSSSTGGSSCSVLDDDSKSRTWRDTGGSNRQRSSSSTHGWASVWGWNGGRFYGDLHDSTSWWSTSRASVLRQLLQGTGFATALRFPSGEALSADSAAVRGGEKAGGTPAAAGEATAEIKAAGRATGNEKEEATAGGERAEIAREAVAATQPQERAEAAAADVDAALLAEAAALAEELHEEMIRELEQNNDNCKRFAISNTERRPEDSSGELCVTCGAAAAATCAAGAGVAASRRVVGDVQALSENGAGPHNATAVAAAAASSSSCPNTPLAAAEGAGRESDVATQAKRITSCTPLLNTAQHPLRGTRSAPQRRRHHAAAQWEPAAEQQQRGGVWLQETEAGKEEMTCANSWGKAVTEVTSGRPVATPPQQSTCTRLLLLGAASAAALLLTGAIQRGMHRREWLQQVALLFRQVQKLLMLNLMRYSPRN